MIKEDQLVQVIAEACVEEKANDVLILDVNELTVIADYFVIATGRSMVQVKSIIDYVEEKVMDECNILPIRREGHQQGVWAILDYGSTILHVFRQEERDYYDLESLWGDAREVSVESN